MTQEERRQSNNKRYCERIEYLCCCNYDAFMIDIALCLIKG